MSDWIDETLWKAEQIPVLGGFARDLRFVYDVWHLPTIDAGPMQAMANICQDLYFQLDGITEQFYENLGQLGRTWSGNEADYYVGQLPTGFEIEHDMEPPNQSVSMQISSHLQGTRAALDYNHAAHQKGFQHINHMNDLHNQLDAQFMLALGTLAFMAAIAPVPGADLVDAGPTEIAETAEVGAAVNTANTIVAVRTTTEAYDIVTVASQIAFDADRAYDAMQFINRMRMIGGIFMLIDAGVAVVSIVVGMQDPNGSSAPVAQPLPRPNPFGGVVEAGDCGPGNPNIPVTNDEIKALKDALAKEGIQVDNEVALKALLRQYGKDIDKTVQAIKDLRSAFPNDFSGSWFDSIVALKALYGLSNADIQRIIDARKGPPDFDFGGKLTNRNNAIKDGLRKLWNQLMQTFSPEDLNGTWRELHDCEKDSTAQASSHIQELQEAARTIQNLMSALERKLAQQNDPALQTLYDNLKKLLTKLSDIVGGSAQPAPNALSPLLADLLAIFS